MRALKALILWAAFAATSVFAQSVTLNAAITFPNGLPGGANITGYSQRPIIVPTDAREPSFKKGIGNTIYFKAGAQLEIGGVLCAPTSDQAVTLPTLVAGTDYRIAAKTDCSLTAYTYADVLPSGALVVGGFHHLIGSPATDLDTGGGWTPTLLEWSIWDLSFRPRCDPRGMSRIGHTPVWLDIYWQGDSSNADGVSRNNDPILTGTNPPLRPADYGGNGTAKYATMAFYEANEHLAQHGKRLPTYRELVLAGFGTNEGDGRGAHPVKTGFATANTPPNSDPNFTGKFGHIQITGVLWAWTQTFAYWPGPATANSWGWEAYDNTGARGKSILPNPSGYTVILQGGSHVYTASGSPTGATAVAGSRAMETIEKPSDVSVNIGVRGVCDQVSR
jgi:hypothetical protein